jgi:hypothetical protein
VAPVVTEHANASRAASWTPAEPLRTQCAEVKGGHFALATAFLTKYRADNAGSAATAPFPTITANGDSDRPGGNPPLARQRIAGLAARQADQHRDLAGSPPPGAVLHGQVLQLRGPARRLR